MAQGERPKGQGGAGRGRERSQEGGGRRERRAARSKEGGARVVIALYEKKKGTPVSRCAPCVWSPVVVVVCLVARCSRLPVRSLRCLA